MTADLVEYPLNPITFEDTGWLAAQVEAFVKIRDERDRARRWAVSLEQENAELLSQIAGTLEWLAGAPCDCPNAAWSESDPDRDPCSRCIVLSYLQPPRALFLHYGNPQ